MLPTSSVILARKAANLPEATKKAQIEGRCLFVGSNNRPNQEGLEWFLANVWPEVLRLFPGATLDIAGNVSVPDSAKTDPSIQYLGRVDHLANVYATASLAIVPLLSGSGMKIKVVEAAAHGTPIVTTSIGLQGLSILRNLVNVEDDPLSFARSAAASLGDPGRCLESGKALQTKVSEELSPEACYHSILRLIKGGTSD